MYQLSSFLQLNLWYFRVRRMKGIKPGLDLLLSRRIRTLIKSINNEILRSEACIAYFGSLLIQDGAKTPWKRIKFAIKSWNNLRFLRGRASIKWSKNFLPPCYDFCREVSRFLDNFKAFNPLLFEGEKVWFKLYSSFTLGFHNLCTLPQECRLHHCFKKDFKGIWNYLAYPQQNIVTKFHILEIKTF